MRNRLSFPKSCCYEVDRVRSTCRGIWLLRVPCANVEQSLFSNSSVHFSFNTVDSVYAARLSCLEIFLRMEFYVKLQQCPSPSSAPDQLDDGRLYPVNVLDLEIWPPCFLRTVTGCFTNTSLGSASPCVQSSLDPVELMHRSWRKEQEKGRKCLAIHMVNNLVAINCFNSKPKAAIDWWVHHLGSKWSVNRRRQE